jgi:hypothetical protein
VKSASLTLEKAAHALAQKVIRSRVVKNETLRSYRQFHPYKRLVKVPYQTHSDVGEKDMRSVMKPAKDDLAKDVCFTFRNYEGKVYIIPSSQLF